MHPDSQPPEAEAGIQFFTEPPLDFDFSQPAEAHAEWLNRLAMTEGFRIDGLNYVFCSDDYLLDINRQYLDHDTYTDIITFDNSEAVDAIEGDVFISVERVRENAEQFSADFDSELRRVLAHGLLHLCGYGDKSADEIEQMRRKEDAALALY